MLKIICTLVMCLLGFTFANPAIAGKSLAEAYAVSPDSIEVDPAYVEAVVRDYFKDIPVMIEIARCESGFRQYEDNGLMVENPSPDSSASGVYGILYIKHFKLWSTSPETNITTLKGNLAYARKMYMESGTAPWAESESCWSHSQKPILVADATN